MRTSVSLACLLLAGCTDAPAGPGAAQPAVLESARFRLVDFGGLAPAVRESLIARAEREFDRVAALLPGLTAPTPVELRIERGTGIPFVSIGPNRMTHWSAGVAPEYFTHQLTHLFTRYRRSNFIEEGLAVWVTEVLLLTGETPDPFRGQPSHAWVALFEQYGSSISLFTALRATNLGHDYAGSSADASAWQLFLEAGSFTGWLIGEFGFDKWELFYDTGILGSAVGLDTPTAEGAWKAYVAAAYPEPLACEDALGDVGEREAFWCARATGN